MTLTTVTISEEKHRFFMRKMGYSRYEPFTREEYEELGKKLTLYLGGPASSHIELGMDHWAELPIYFKPIKMDRNCHQELFNDITETIYFLRKKGINCSGILEWKESSPGQWHDQHYRLMVCEPDKDNDDHKLFLSKMKHEYEPFED